MENLCQVEYDNQLMRLRTNIEEARYASFVKMLCDRFDRRNIIEDDYLTYSIDDVINQLSNYDERLIADYVNIFRDKADLGLLSETEWNKIKSLRRR